MAIRKRLISPRQKMINLMYIVLLAMLALNVSTEVLDGFSLVDAGLRRTTANASRENVALYHDFAAALNQQPEKVKAWFAQAKQVKEASDSLYNLLQDLKVALVQQADGRDGDVTAIRHKDNVEAANIVMLAPGTGRGNELFNAINQYRNQLLTMVDDTQQRSIISSNLATTVPQQARRQGKNWQEYCFENMPVAAVVTQLSKLQSDVRYAEGEVLHTLVANIDVHDVRVNQLKACVIPEKTTLYPGESFKASIVMAAVDTTQRPQIVVGGRPLTTPNGQYAFTVSGIGEHAFSGYIAVCNRQGEWLRRPFTQTYRVVPAPHAATVAADMMNVLYAGYPNPVSVSVPGVPTNAVQVMATGGRLQAKGNGHYVLTPHAVGQPVTISVRAMDHGQQRSLPTTTFQVRKLPDPTAYLGLGTNRFKGGSLSKGALLSATRVQAAIDDGLLDIPFRVLGFETVFFDALGNAVPIASAGADFSDRQRETFRGLSRNRRFYITHVRAVGPDGVVRTLQGALEIIVK